MLYIMNFYTSITNVCVYGVATDVYRRIRNGRIEIIL